MLGEKHEIGAVKPRVRNNQTVEFEEMGSGGERLRCRVFEGAVTSDIDAEGRSLASTAR